MKIISIKRKNYSWTYYEEKRDYKNHKYSMEVSVNTQNKVDEYKDEKRIKGKVSFEMIIWQEQEKIAEYLDSYLLIMSDDKLKNYSYGEMIEDKNLDKKILSIVEPYIRVNLEKPLNDAEFPTGVLNYRFWEGAETS